MNVFEPAPQANASSFTALRILEYLQTGLGQTGELRPADFVGFDQIFEAFAPYGWSRSEITFNVQRLAYFGLLAPESGDNKSLLVDTSYALTKSGTYYIDTLYCQFSYFSSVACDTTVSELEVANELADILRGSLGGPKIPLRARRLIAEKFIGYLGAKESLETKGAIAKHPILASITFVPRMVEALKTIPLA
jgi:hypothetical protein